MTVSTLGNFIHLDEMLSTICQETYKSINDISKIRNRNIKAGHCWKFFGTFGKYFNGIAKKEKSRKQFQYYTWQDVKNGKKG